MNDTDSDKSVEDIQVELIWQHMINGVPDLRTKLSLRQGYLICAAETEIFVIFVSAFHYDAVSTADGSSMVERSMKEVFGSLYNLRCLLVSQEDWQRLQGHFYASREVFMAAIS